MANVERNKSAKVDLLAGRCMISLIVATLGEGGIEMVFSSDKSFLAFQKSYFDI
jgi:hypothetical protein